MNLDILMKAISCKKCNDKWFKQEDAPEINNSLGDRKTVYTCEICSKDILTDKGEPLILIFDVRSQLSWP